MYSHPCCRQVCAEAAWKGSPALAGIGSSVSLLRPFFPMGSASSPGCAPCERAERTREKLKNKKRERSWRTTFLHDPRFAYLQYAWSLDSQVCRGRLTRRLPIGCHDSKRCTHRCAGKAATCKALFRLRTCLARSKCGVAWAHLCPGPCTREGSGKYMQRPPTHAPHWHMPCTASGATCWPLRPTLP